MKKISKHLIAFAIIALLVAPIFVAPVFAQSGGDTYGVEVVNTGLGGSLGASDQDPRAIVGRFITLALGFLGLIAVGIILIGGFKWMTSGGNEEKTTEAKKLLGAGVIGLIIVLASWGLASWLITNVSGTVSGTSV
jgi:hypothetical protein